VTAIKGSIGHLIGGSGAVAAIMALWSMRHRQLPPIAGLQNLDPAISIDAVRGEPRPVAAGYAMVDAFGFGGINAVLLLAGPPAG